MLSLQEHFRIISETASDAIVTIDETSIIRFANHATTRVFGYLPEQLIGQPLTMLMPERMRHEHRAGVNRHVATGQRKLDWKAIDLPGLHSDGHEIALEISFGDYVEDGKHFYTGIMRDVSERKQMERRLDAERAVMRILTASQDSVDAINQVLATLGSRFGWAFGAYWQLDDEGKYLEPRAQWSVPELFDTAFAQATHNTTLAFGTGLPGRVWATGAATWIRDLSGEDNFPRLASASKDGLQAAVAFPIRQGGRLCGVMEFFSRKVLDTDASLLAMMETVGVTLGQYLENREALENLQQANQVKSQFLATMSHELRTPLNAMIGYSQLLIDGVPDPIPPGAKQKAERILLSAKHLLGLIDEILTYSRTEAGQETAHLEVFDGRDIAREVALLVEPLAQEKQLGFAYELPDGAMQLLSDPRKLRQILLNLLGNAIKFTDAGKVTLKLVEDGDQVWFEVCDTGPGIPADFHEKIFEPFWQASSGHTNRVAGTGLGLSVTRTLAQMLGGDVELESTEGLGSTFRVRLPKRNQR